MREAFALNLEVLREKGDPIPPPRASAGEVEVRMTASA